MTYQRNTFVSIMENYNKVLQYTTESANAAGTAERKYEAVLDSIDAKINKLTATYENFVNNLNASDAFKGTVDILTSLVEILDIVINKSGLLKAGIAALIGVGISKLASSINSLINIFKKYSTLFNTHINLVGKGEEQIKALANNWKNLNSTELALILANSKLSDSDMDLLLSTMSLDDATKKYIKTLSKRVTIEGVVSNKTKWLGKDITVFNGKAKILGTTLGTLNNALGKVGLGFTSVGSAISTGILVVTAAIAAYNAYQNSVKESIQKFEDARASYKEFNSEMSSNLSYLDTSKERFEELSKGVSQYGENISLTADEYREYQQIVSEIVQTSPSLIEGYNAEGEAIVNKNKLLERSVELLEQERKLELKKITTQSNYSESLKGARNAYKEAKINTKGMDNALDSIIDNIMKNLSNGSISLSDIGLSIGQKGGQNYENFIKNNIDTVISSFQKNSQSLLNSEKITTETFDSLNSAIDVYSREVSTYNSELEKTSKGMNYILEAAVQLVNGYDKLDNQLVSIIDSFINGYSIDDKTSKEQIQNYINEVTKFTNNLINNTETQSLIEKLFAFGSEEENNKQLLVQEYKKQVLDLINQIAESLQLTEEQRSNFVANLRLKVGIDIIDGNGNQVDATQAGIDNIVSHFKTDFTNSLNTLSQEQFEVAMKIAPKVEDTATWEQFLSRINGLIASAGTEMANFSQIGSQFADSVSNTFSNINILNSALDEFNTYGYLAADTFKSISDNNLLEYLNFTSNGLQVNTQALLDAAEAARQKSIEDLNASYASSVLSLAQETLSMSDEELAKAESQATQQANILAVSLNNAGNSALTAARLTQYALDALKELDISFSSAQQKYFDAGLEKINKQYLAVRGSMLKAGTAVQTTTKHIGGLGQSTKDLEKASKASAKAAKDQKDALADLKKEISDLISELNKAQGNVDDLIQMTIKMLRQQYEDQKKELQEQLNKLTERYEKEQEYIEKETEAYKEKLDLEREFLQEKEKERQYEKDLDSKRNDISKIQADLDALQFDNSIEAQKKKLQLAQDLADKEEELDDFQHEHEVETIEDAIDKEEKRWDELQEKKLKDLEEEYKKQKDLLDKRIKEIEEYVSKEFNLWKEAIDLINGRSDEFYHNLMVWNIEYGDHLMNTVVRVWEDAYSVLEKYTNYGKIDTVYALETIAARLRDAQQEQERLSKLAEDSAGAADDVADAVDGIGDAAYGASNGINQMTENLYDAYAAAKSVAKEMDKIWERGSDYSGVGSHKGYTLPTNTNTKSSRYEEEYGTKNKELSSRFEEEYGSKSSKPQQQYKYIGNTLYTHDPGSSKWYIARSHVGESVVSKQTTPLDDFLGLKPDETLRILKVGEGILTPEQNAERMKMNLDGYDSSISDKANSMSNSHNYSGDSSVSVSIGDIVINGNADKSTVEALKKQREEIIQGVFKKIQFHSVQSGYVNAKRFTL